VPKEVPKCLHPEPSASAYTQNPNLGAYTQNPRLKPDASP